MRGTHVRGALLLVALVTVALLAPGAGFSRPPESDGSTYTWPGAATLTVDVKPWGGGYVRSDPYLIDCPNACIRAFDPGREVKLTAYMTPGHTFKGWEGACAGQGNPCTIKVTGPMDVSAVLEGQYVAPAAPKPDAPAVNPALKAVTEGLHTSLTGTGYNPNSSVTIDFDYLSPAGFGQSFPDARTSDASGAWSAGFVEDCRFPDTVFSGPIEVDVTATDAGGASASDHISTSCP
jgi:hypothetical protein